MFNKEEWRTTQYKKAAMINSTLQNSNQEKSGNRRSGSDGTHKQTQQRPPQLGESLTGVGVFLFALPFSSTNSFLMNAS